MPRPSGVSQLPENIRDELDKKLISNGFSDYAGLEAWLAEKEYFISSSAIHRYGKDFKVKVENIKLLTAQAKVIVENAGDDEAALDIALNNLAQSKLFQLLLNVDIESNLSEQGDEQEGNPQKISFLGLVKAVSQLNRSSITIRRFREEMREKAKRAINIIKKEIKDKGGISTETIHHVEVILGIANDN